VFETFHQGICSIYKASLNPGSVQQIMTQLLVHVATAKFKPLIFSVLGFSLNAGCPSLLLFWLARGGPEDIGAAMLSGHWLDGRLLEEWHFE
jgi:hypothetical protein